MAAEDSVMWRWPVVVMTAAAAAMFGLILYSPNFGSLVGAWLVAPFAGFILVVLMFRATGQARWMRVGVLSGFALLSWVMVSCSVAVRSETRWLAHSRQWKNAVLAEPINDAGMKAVVWDGWGGHAQNTFVYLVYSPDDALRQYSPEKLQGLPCPVSDVQRLEKQWYSVTFATNGLWGLKGDCGSA